MLKLILYLSHHCHLCEQAYEQFELSDFAEYCELTEVDIASDQQLIKQYGRAIPVLWLVNTGSVLHWPFDVHDVNRWLDSQINN